MKAEGYRLQQKMLPSQIVGHGLYSPLTYFTVVVGPKNPSELVAKMGKTENAAGVLKSEGQLSILDLILPAPRLATVLVEGMTKLLTKKTMSGVDNCKCPIRA